MPTQNSAFKGSRFTDIQRLKLSKFPILLPLVNPSTIRNGKRLSDRSTNLDSLAAIFDDTQRVGQLERSVALSDSPNLKVTRFNPASQPIESITKTVLKATLKEKEEILQSLLNEKVSSSIRTVDMHVTSSNQSIFGVWYLFYHKNRFPKGYWSFDAFRMSNPPCLVRKFFGNLFGGFFNQGLRYMIRCFSVNGGMNSFEDGMREYQTDSLFLRGDVSPSIRTSTDLVLVPEDNRWIIGADGAYSTDYRILILKLSTNCILIPQIQATLHTFMEAFKVTNPNMLYSIPSTMSVSRIRNCICLVSVSTVPIRIEIFWESYLFLKFHNLPIIEINKIIRVYNLRNSN